MNKSKIAEFYLIRPISWLIQTKENSDKKNFGKNILLKKFGNWKGGNFEVIFGSF